MTINWLLVFLGINDISGPFYAFWSGFGSDLGEFAIVAAILKMVNCHKKGCWRLGLHHSGHVVCHKHRIQAEPPEVPS